MANLVFSPFCPGASVLNAKFAREHPDLARAVVAASDEAADEIERDASKKSLLTQFTALDAATAAKVPMNGFTSLSELTPAELDAVQQFVNLFYEQGVTKTQVRVRGMLVSLPAN
jgi:ABC-type nitrate/sulfonate/bicarbonate transport system substrate-binding protein